MMKGGRVGVREDIRKEGEKKERRRKGKRKKKKREDVNRDVNVERIDPVLLWFCLIHFIPCYSKSPKSRCHE